MTATIQSRARVEQISFREYLSAPGFSFHGMKEMSISDLHYWYFQFGPGRETREENEFQMFGTSLHTAVLEPDSFDGRYARKISIEDYPGCLRTVDDMKAWMSERGKKTKGTLKAEIINQVLAVDADAPILSIIEAEHATKHAGKTILSCEDFDRVAACARNVLDEPRVQELLDGAEIEQSVFAPDPQTNVVLKSRNDIWNPKKKRIGDIKTFTQKRGKSIDQTVADAIFYEKYYVQAVHYAMMRGWPEQRIDVAFVFVESEPPHEVRIKVLSPTVHGEASLYWETARFEIRRLIDRYAYCIKEFGVERPWRWAQEVDPLIDEEMKGLVFA